MDIFFEIDLPGFLLFLIGRFSLVNIHGWLSEQISRSQAALGTTFRVTGTVEML
jgi:hypothetical protein